MWFGTHDGLNRFDGYEFKVFRNQLEDSTSLPHNFIYNVFADQQNNIWVGTGQGIGIFNNLTSKFRSAYFIVKNTGRREKITVPVNVIKAAPNGDILIGTNGSGLMVQSKNTESAFQISVKKGKNQVTDYNVTNIKIGTDQRIWLFINPIGLCIYDAKSKQIKIVNQTIQEGFCLETDNREDIWIGTQNGLYKYHVPSNSMLLMYKEGKDMLTSEYVTSLCFDEQHNLWIGTRAGGVNVLNHKSGKIDYLLSGGIKSSPGAVSVTSIYEDNEGRKWIATLKGGINIVQSRNASFKTISQDPFNSASLVNNYVSSFLEDQEGKLWIGTDGGGISIWNRNQNKFNNLKYQAGNSHSLSNNVVSNIVKDYQGNIWVATFGGGINRYNRSNGTFDRFRCINNVSGLENKNVWQLFEDSDHILWATTFSAGKLYYLNSGKNGFEVFDQKLYDLMSISEDHNKVLWSGNYRYLIKIDKKQKKHTYYDIGKPVRAIYEDKKGNFWIGSEGGGLVLFNRREGKIIKRYSTVNGLCNNSILNILEDDKGNLWISTSSGLSKFNPEDVTFLNFYQDDGLQSNQFLESAALKLRSGEMVFGGLKGFNIFHPDSIYSNKSIPPVLITGLKINNMPVSIDGPYITQTKEDRIEALKIPFDEAIVSFEFAALEYSAPGKISYAYYLEGWDNNWNYSGKLRTASYTRLKEGRYILHVKSTNAEGLWVDNDTIIKVTVLPPWFRSWWAYLIYSIAGIGVIYVYALYQKHQSNLKHQIDLANLEVKQEQEMAENKLSFFTHISHEFRTPLTLIINPIKDFINAKNSQIDSKDLIVVYRNARRLLSLVDQLLLFRKSEVQNLKLAKFDLVSFCKEIYVCFSQQAKSKNITFDFQCTANEISIYADREKMEIVLFNLIANAFKFTPDGGTITLTIDEKNDEIELHVTDTGAGISEDTGSKIFERFYQDSNQNSVAGFGIGLFLVKKFVEGHGGTVTYKSTIGQGTDFMITILKRNGHFDDHLIQEEEARYLIVPEMLEDDCSDTWRDIQINESNEEEIAAIDLDPTTEKKVILIVEDNSDIRNYIKQIFKSEYLIYEAEDGTQGYELVQKYAPDLVITDVMMKELSGIELCVKIKSNVELSHIPVILLTSSSSSEIKLKGIEEGADDFITKPFDKDILIARVANLLKSRNTLQRYFFNEITLMSQDFKISGEYKEFLEKCIAITEKHLDDSDFNVKTLADELAISPSVLYKKVKLISGRTTNEFIRYIRLRKAAQILVNSDFNINEIAMLCGFNDVRYFREQFSKLFGMRPSDYIKKYRGNLTAKHRVIRAY